MNFEINKLVLDMLLSVLELVFSMGTENCMLPNEIALFFRVTISCGIVGSKLSMHHLLSIVSEV